MAFMRTPTVEAIPAANYITVNFTNPDLDAEFGAQTRQDIRDRAGGLTAIETQINQDVAAMQDLENG